MQSQLGQKIIADNIFPFASCKTLFLFGFEILYFFLWGWIRRLARTKAMHRFGQNLIAI